MNDRCAFPMVLDMEPYTAEYLAAMEEFKDAAGATGMGHSSSARGGCVVVALGGCTVRLHVGSDLLRDS